MGSKDYKVAKRPLPSMFRRGIVALLALYLASYPLQWISFGVPLIVVRTSETVYASMYTSSSRDAFVYHVGLSGESTDERGAPCALAPVFTTRYENRGPYAVRISLKRDGRVPIGTLRVQRFEMRTSEGSQIQDALLLEVDSSGWAPIDAPNCVVSSNGERFQFSDGAAVSLRVDLEVSIGAQRYDVSVDEHFTVEVTHQGGPSIETLWSLTKVE